MSKLSQLQACQSLGIPTPAFAGVSYEDFRADRYDLAIAQLKFPVAVRSSFDREDGAEHSLAGHFHSELHVSREDLFSALDRVFSSYPDPVGQHAIVQEMVTPSYSGVLFAFRDYLWKTELAPGAEGGTAGDRETIPILLPKFTLADKAWSRWYRFWSPFQDRQRNHLIRPLIALSAYTGLLMDHYQREAPHGLDVEYAIAKGKLYVLQARPITTPQEAEEILTSANHKEILPPQPSPFMSGLIASCSRHLFGYYQKLDPTLGPRAFIELSGGMPWINLTALLDVMVHWGLPTALVTESVGAEDCYRVSTRWHRALRKLPVFLRVLKGQLSVVAQARQWVANTQRTLRTDQAARRKMWFNEPDLAFTNWLTQLQLLYVDLVSLMQAHTGAVSGPARLLARWGLLQRLRPDTLSHRYLQAFQAVARGELDREAFLAEYGHRGFYESDLGQRRFSEYDTAAFQQLLPTSPEATATPARRPGLWSRLLSRLLDPILSMVSSREWLRHETMKMFAALREEIKTHTQSRFGDQFDFARYRPEDLARGIEENWQPQLWAAVFYPQPSGWDMDTFLSNRLGRRLPLNYLATISGNEQKEGGLGIYPGRVRGQIWRVDAAEAESLRRPSYPTVILLTESLDPGWIPYFVQVQGVLSYVGGILSHASIILRESQIPSVTHVPRSLDLQHGDWVELDGRKGLVRKLEPPQVRT